MQNDSSNLSNIFIKLWSYITENEYCDAMKERLLEELEEMSGTCSTGFLSRLVNTLSGFGNLSIRISFDDQIISNFTGRLNMYARKLTDVDSIFRNEKLYDVIELYIYTHKINKKYPKVKSMKKLIDLYLETDRDDKIDTILEDFEEQVLKIDLLVAGSGDFLPKHSGNLDVLTSTALWLIRDTIQKAG